LRTILVLLAVTAVTCAAGCSRSNEEAAVPESGEATMETSEERVTSEAARARGLRVESDEGEEGSPVVTLEEVVYEWQVQPSVGLLVSLEFGNDNVVFERARAYVFLTTWYSERASANRGVFPLDAEIGEQDPVDYTSGTHIVYRQDHTMKCFIPYTYREGYYDSLRLLVYSEEGELIIDQGYDLEITGEPSGRVKMKPVLTL
jgi:hypothetical protein